MGWTLRGDVSFCAVEGTHIFLDLSKNRYFALPPAADAAFARLLAGADTGAHDRAALDALIAPSILKETVEARLPQPCQASALATRDQPSTRYADTPGRVGVCCISRALLDLRWARRRVNDGRLATSLDRLAPPLSVPADNSARTAAAVLACLAAFRTCGLLVSEHDQCLHRSLAMARYLGRNGVRPRIVFGVTARPFTAHCWLQIGDRVLQDDPDDVAIYTPILIR